MSKSKNLKGIAIGTAVAALAGYVTGILTAPKSGKETREDIKKTAHNTMSEAEKELKKLHTELTKLLEESKKRGGNLSDKATKELAGLVEKAKESKEKAREVLSAIHEGNAEDQDLRIAINEANKAIEHIREYLKK
jgi:gas vesicle protein